MSSINYTNYNIDQTVRVFDSFYEYDVQVPAAEFDLVHSFFLREMSDRTAAGNFTVSLFRVAETTKIPVLTLLQQFEEGLTGIGPGQLSGMGLNASMAYYLNSIRSRASLLGVGVPVQPNFYAARAVIQ